MATAKLINEPERAVEENLEGFVAAQPQLCLLQGFRVVLRRDRIADAAPKKVSVVCGGGSGHEPVFAGFVGGGCLDGAVAGSVFASPPPSSVLAALQALAPNSSGILQLVFNYTGDRLNFGLAVERALAEGLGPVEMVVLGEDSALTGKDRSAGRRGLAGSLLALKVAGALAESGAPLAEVAAKTRELATALGTVGVALSSCSLPGQGPIFHLAPDEMEVGLGVHGEPGIRRSKVASAKDTVGTLLDHLTSPESKTSLRVAAGDSIVLLINNLGSLTNLEQNIVTGEALRWLESKGLKTVRVLSGPLMTSLEMQGVSVSLLNVSRLSFDVLPLLDAPCGAPAWPKPTATSSDDYKIQKPVSLPHVTAGTVKDSGDGTGATVGAQEAERLRAVVVAVTEALVKAEEELNGLDQAAGDGDCGNTMATGARALQAAMARLDFGRPCGALAAMSEVWLAETGGTSGPIYSLLLTGLSSALREALSGEAWLEGLGRGIASVQRYGMAQRGDRTLLDALIPALEAGPKGLGAMALAAAQGAAATAGMEAKAGRASYVGSANLARPDPGATAIAIIAATIHKQLL